MSKDQKVHNQNGNGSPSSTLKLNNIEILGELLPNLIQPESKSNRFDSTIFFNWRGKILIGTQMKAKPNKIEAKSDGLDCQ